MPSRLPQLSNTATQLDDGLNSPKHQLHYIYKPKDARKIQSLDPVFTLDDLRRTGVIGSRDIQSSLAYPGLSPNFLNEPLDAGSDDDGDDYDDGGSDGHSGSSTGCKGHGPRAPPRSLSPDQAPNRLDPLRYSATASARAVLLHEKPAVVERMEKGVAACAVLRDNRRFRLFSLGVFQPAVNDVRTRSMHRVELHKHLSSTNLRAPQSDKEVRSAVHNDTVGTRLERMYHRVLRAVDTVDSAPPSPPLGSGVGGGGVGGHGAPGQAGGAGGGAAAAGAGGPVGLGGGGGGRRLSPPGMVTANGPMSLARRESTRRGVAPGDVEGRAGAGQPPSSPQQNQQQQQQQPSGVAGGLEMTRGPHLQRIATIRQHRPSAMPGSSGGGGGAVTSPGPGVGGAAAGGSGGGGGSGPRCLFTIPSVGRNGSGQPPPPQQQQQQQNQQAQNQQAQNQQAQQQQNQQQQSLQPPGSPNGNGGASGGNTQRTTQSADYWMRVTLPPEVIEAQLRHLAAAAEANLRAYHDKVAAAQDDLLRSSGLSTEALGMPSEIVEQSLKVKLGQIQEDTTVNNFNYSSLGREAVLASQLGPASKQLLTATTLPQFIRAALDHVQYHNGELAQLKVAMMPPEGRRRSMHRRPRAKSSTAPSVALLRPLGTLGANQPTTNRTDGGDSSRTLTLATERTHTTAPDTANGDDDATEADGSAATLDGSGLSSSSAFWPSYMTLKQRATSAGGQLAAAAEPSASAAGGGSSMSLSGASASQGQGQAVRLTDDVDAAHLEHLRRHASPDSAAREPLWSPPPPVLAGRPRTQGPGPGLGPMTPGTALMGSGGAAAAAMGGLGTRRLGTFIDDEWMAKFRSELLAVEARSPERTPEGLLPLPPLPPVNMDAGTYVRCRLERLWTLLDVPPPLQLDMVLAFTGRDQALQFARNLELWEQAAVAVLGREAQVEALVTAQREIEAGRADMLSLTTVAELCVRVLQQTRWVEELSARLRASCGWALSYHGKPYPGAEAIASTHLLAFMEQLRQVTQITGLRP